MVEEDGNEHRLWRVTDPAAIAAVEAAVEPPSCSSPTATTATRPRASYAEEIGGEGAHRYVLMCLVALQDHGLTVFPTHRLVNGLRDDSAAQVALADALRAAFDIQEIAAEDLVPGRRRRRAPAHGLHGQPLRRAFRLTLKDQAIADAALPGMPEPYRRLDTAVARGARPQGPLGLTEDDISHLRGLGYARSFAEARELVESGTYDVGFFLGATPVEHVQEVAAAGVNMPPKSTYFFPKVLTGLLINPLMEAQ